jgi:hypothetical protein
VTKVHVEVAKLAKEGYEFIMIGHKGHPEVEGTMGQLSEGIYLVEDVADVARVQPADRQAGGGDADHAERGRRGRDPGRGEACFPHVREPKKQDICYATQNRQDAVKVMAPQVDVVIVVGSPTSSNSNRLRELAERLGTRPTWSTGRRPAARQWFEGRAARGPDGRRLGARHPGAAGHRAPARAGRGGGAPHARRGGDVHFPLPKGLGDRSMSEPDRPPDLDAASRLALTAWPSHRSKPAPRRGPAAGHRRCLQFPLSPRVPICHARHQPAAPRPRRRGRAARTRKTPQPFLDVPRFSALEAERKRMQTRTEDLQARATACQQADRPAKGKGEDCRASRLMAQVAGIADELKAGAERLERAAGRAARPADVGAQPAAGQRAGGRRRDRQRRGAPLGHAAQLRLCRQGPCRPGRPAGAGLRDRRQAVGSRFSFLRGPVARLHRALAQFMLDMQTTKHGYTECYTPYIVNREVLEGTGQLPKFKEDMFWVSRGGDDDRRPSST